MVELGDNHYKIEDAISRFWNVKDHIKLLTEQYIDSPKVMTEDEMWNHLAAVEAMVELYTEAAMDTYCKVFQLNEYATPEAKAYREELFDNFSKNRQDWFNLATSVTKAPKKTAKKGKKK